MTSTTEELAPATIGGRLGRVLRFVAAFAVGAALAVALAAGLALAYEARYAGLVLPGVRVGSVDAGGLSPAELAARLRSAYAGLAVGELRLTTPAGTTISSYEELGRRIDADALVAEALTVARPADPLDRLGAEVRLLVGGLEVQPRVVVDEAELRRVIEAAAVAARLDPVDATAVLGADGYVATRSVPGRSVEIAPALAVATATLTVLEAPTDVALDLPAVTVAPDVEQGEAMAAAIAANRMSAPLVLAAGDERWTLGAKSIRGWLGFGVTPDGRYEPTVDPLAVQRSLTVVARKVLREPKDASFLMSKEKVVVGVEPSAEGRRLDVTSSTAIVAAAIRARAGLTAGTPSVAPAVVVVPPRLTTEQATAVAPEMRMVGEWETYYPIGLKNGFGANIEIPTSLIDGTVVPAGGVFDFWQATGDPTAANGYRQGGAIINGRTEPQGALAGGICSCSTTLFNAALRAGFRMGARMNHYYYIDRYPLGLDATVYISSGGGRQSMSWTNDTEYPVLIKGSIRTKGEKGWVRFELWSVPTGRTVELTDPIVKNIRPATTITERTTRLPAGRREQIEWPADGKDVWVTRIVRDGEGNMIRTETYVSHYARVDGIIQVGIGTAPEPSPAPSVGPSPSPAP